MSGDGKDTTWLDKLLHNAVEQPGHAAWGFVPIAIYLTLDGHPIVGGACAAAAAALPREIIDQWPISRWWDTALDLAFFALGGATAGWLLS